MRLILEVEHLWNQDQNHNTTYFYIYIFMYMSTIWHYTVVTGLTEPK